MANNQIILSGLTPDEFIELMRPMVQAEVNRIKAEQPEKLLSPAEVCAMFQPKITKPTLTSWTDQGKLQSYKIGGRIYYKASEVLASLPLIKKYQIS